MTEKETAKLLDKARDRELVYRLAADCIVRIDEAGGTVASREGVRRVARAILEIVADTEIIEKREQENDKPGC